MYAEERRQAMVELARREGRVEGAALAARFDVTQETVRRDLTDLEHRGLVRRVHGGAIPVERLRAEPPVADKAQQMAGEKRRIAKAALAEVPENGTLLLDAGTTTGALAEIIPADRDLTVVTNDLTIGARLSTHRNVTLLMIGGRVRHETLANVDDWALRTLEELSVDVAFVASNGVSIARGLSTHDPAEAAVKRAMVAAGRRVVLLADHGKVAQEHFVRFARVSDVDVFVTDDGLSDEHAARFEEAGVEVVLA